MKGFKNYCISTEMGEIDDEMLWNAVKRMGTLGVSVRMMKALPVHCNSSFTFKHLLHF
jgi:Arc/MetJ family transcription regulator